MNGLFLLLLLSFNSHVSPLIDLYIDTSEGSAVSERQLSKLKSYLNVKQCFVSDILHFNELSFGHSRAFVFYPIDRKMPTSYKKLLSLETLANTPLSASILVRKSTGINSFKSLGSVHIAYLSNKSNLGYRLPKQFFETNDIVFPEHKITRT
jgi:hypothetical protein